VKEELRYGQPVLEDGKLGPPTPYVLVRSRSVEDGKLVFKDSYYMRDPGGSGKLLEAPEMRLVDDRHGGFTDKKELTAWTDSGAVKAGDTVQVQMAAAQEGSGAEDLWRYVYKGKEIALTDAALKNFQARPLDEVQKRKLGLTLKLEEEVSDLVVTAANLAEILKIPGLEGVKEGAVVKVWQAPVAEGEIPKVRYRYQGREINLTPKQAALLGTGTAPDLVDYQNVTEAAVTVNGQELKPGASVQMSQRAFAALPQKMRAALSDDSVVQARAIKKKDFRAAWEIVRARNPALQTPGNKNPTDTQLNSLFARFPGSRTASGLDGAIFDELRLSIPEVPGDAVTEPLVREVSDTSYDYAAATEEKLNKAATRYNALLGRGLFTTPWKSLSFIEKQAFAGIASKRLDPGKVQEQLAGALKVLSDRRDKFKNPSPDARVTYAAAIRSLILLKSIKKGGDLNQTGKLEGLFSSLGANVFADYPVVTSTSSQRLNQAMTDLNASLKTISSSEGVDGRPSNFRLQLQQGVLPEFSKSQEVNERNVNTLISKLENAIRAHFGTSLGSDTVIPQSYVRMAREAGIKDVKAESQNYPWINPRVALEEVLPVTKEGTLGALGLFKYSLADVQALYVGKLLPPDDDGGVWQKVSDTEVQRLVKGRREGKKYPFANIFPADTAKRK